MCHAATFTTAMSRSQILARCFKEKNYGTPPARCGRLARAVTAPNTRCARRGHAVSTP